MQRAQIFLLRHGECEGGAILRGRTDVALTAQGRAQMRAALAQAQTLVQAQAKALAQTQVQTQVQVSAPGHETLAWGTAPHLYSSPLRRCADFAAELAADGWRPRELPGLRELDFGDWDGQSWEQLYLTQAEALDAYWQDPWAAAPPGGESMAAFEARVDAAFASVLAALRRASSAAGESPAGPETALLLTHGGVMRHLLARVLGVAPSAGFYHSLALPYAALVRLEVFWGHDEEREAACSYRLHWPGS
ncbi:histidine phosphatase family protein [Shewanella salipaludis]|uniref:Histidine phosphatase family protein n=1 Tax=Shewanella salipaludis TaxID=2723052 RepID=A0A972JL08_9GAMM|nr:histidine phosphatase family protein [Shewanella salipaludis]NMH64927.1 histidine phosphatase family protein [Shewanella salipaludis]